MFTGGGFGRRTNPPIVAEAVHVAKARWPFSGGAIDVDRQRGT